MDKIQTRFWAKVKKTDSCWLWTGSTCKNGYGRFRYQGRLNQAHRLSYAWAVGPIPDGLFVCHKCDTPSCVNPNHLFTGTNADNMKDAHSKGRLPLFPLDYRGEKCQHSVLTEDQVRRIRQIYAKGNTSQRELGERFEVSKSHIGSIVRRENWSWLSD